MTDSNEAAFAAGMKVRREMFGPGGAEERYAQATDFNRPLEDVVTRYCFGDLWLREGLSPKLRSMVTVGMLIALGKAPELNIHMRGALANGVTPEELREISLHAILYAGLPAANEGIRTLEAILKQTDPDSPLLQPAPRD